MLKRLVYVFKCNEVIKLATITKRGNSYRIKVTNGRDANNKQIQHTTTYTPKATTPKAIEKELQAFAIEYEKRIHNGDLWDGENIKFSDFVDVWDEKWASDRDNITLGTYECYKGMIDRQFIPIWGNRKISSIKPKDINDLYLKMKKDGRARTTIKKTHTVLNSIMNYAYKMEVIKDNPCSRIDIPKVKKNAIDETSKLHFFELEQARTFLDVALTKRYSYTCRSHNRLLKSTNDEYIVPEHTQSHAIHEQFRCYFYLAIYGGFRRGELIGLTWENIDFKNHSIKITQSIGKTKSGMIVKSPKTISSYREIILPKKCFELLSDWKKNMKKQCLSFGTAWEGYRGAEFDKNSVFITDTGATMHLDTPSHKLKEVINLYNASCENEKDKLPQIRLHDLRHTSATLLLAQNVDIETVSKRLGHSKASITLDIYGHATKSNDKIASDILERAMNQ